MVCRFFARNRRRWPGAGIAAAFAAVALLGLPTSARAQAVTGTLVGNVTDSTGGAIPGATVTALEVETNTSRTAVTNESGYYIFSSLQNGTYNVEAEIQGFKKVVRQNVKVDVNTTVRIDLKLEVGQVSETLTVSAETPLLQTDRTDTGRIIESKMVAELPLTFNRNFQSLMLTVPGVTRPHREHSQFFNSQDSLRFEVNGQPGMASNTLIEGLDDNQKTGLLQVIIPAADALETVSVSTSNYDAEFGRSGGAVTNVTLKSGTNDLKGSVFVFGNTDATNASDYLTHLKAPTKFLNGGFTLGGPIVPNKLFFFGDYQRTLDNNGYVIRATVPTLKMRNGDFSEVTNGIYDPQTGAVTGAGRAAFANNQVPADRVSPIARQLLGFIPAPNIAGAPLGQNNFQQAQTREKTTDGFDAKISYTASSRDQVSYRLSFMRPVVFDPGLYGIYGGPANGGFAGTGTNTSYSTAGNWTRVFSAKTVLDVRGGLNYYHNVTTTQGNGLTTSKDVGIPGANIDEFTSGLSQVSITGYTDPVLGFSASQPWDRSEKTFSLTGTVTRLLKSHTVKLGGEFRYNRDVLLQTQDAGGPRGRFAFNPSGTGNLADTPSTQSFANSFASFLLDWPNTVQRDLKVIDEPGTIHKGLFAFIQDKWQARSNITIDLGLRWEDLHAARRYRGNGRPRELRSGDARDSCCWVRRHRRRAQRREEVHELRAADRYLLAHQRAERRAGGLRREHDSVSRQPLRVQLPGEAELRGNRDQRVPARRFDGDRLPRSGAAGDPLERDHSRERFDPERDVRRDSGRPPRGHAAVLERRLSTAVAVPAHRRHRLRRQPRRGSRDGRGRERQPDLRLRQ